MADVHTPAQRTANMAAIRSRDTKPELIVRRVVHALGYRYRLHGKKLPGKPDIVLTRHRKVIFVHGCFWHSHDCRYGSVKPATRPVFWAEKRRGTARRDEQNRRDLEGQGWNVLVVWECETRESLGLRSTIVEFMRSSR